MRKDLERIKQERLNEERTMKDGEIAKIVEYNNCDDVIIQFIKTGEKINTTYRNFKTGFVKSHFTPTVFGVGITGLEITKINGKNTISYIYWQKMLQRCYDTKYHEKHTTYKDCIVCDEWLYYKNFREWFDNNYYEIEGQRMNLDKDILVKGNKVYSPDTCVFVSQNINKLFLKHDSNRGKHPIGVSYYKSKDKYMSQISLGGNKHKNLGYYNTPEEAFNSYKIAKENYIKEIADKYKDSIPNKLYEAMYNYKVEIAD